MPPNPRRASGRIVRRGLSRLGYDLVRTADRPTGFEVPPDCDAATLEIVRRTQPYTLTPPARIMALCEAVRYIERAQIPGSIVECGVWRGGSVMAALLALLDLDCTERDVHMFDTFTEIPRPDERDVHMSGAPAHEVFDRVVTGNEIFDLLPLDQVRGLLEDTGYPADKLHFVQGLVEDTVPERAPDQIALLRLDTDWYRSTVHEMEHLYRRISSGGILIVDDYGEFSGARQAVDEQVAKDERPVLLNRVDFSCRLVQVP